MQESKVIDLDQLRREFSQRLRELIAAQPETPKLDNFSRETRVSQRQLSQWQSEKWPGWPSAQSTIQIAVTKDVSLNWLFLGIGKQRLSEIKQSDADLQELNTLVSLLLSVTPKTRSKFEEIAKEVLGHADLLSKVAKIVDKESRRYSRD